VTAVTAQNTVTVGAVEPLGAALVTAQIGAVASDIGVDATKVGMLARAAIVQAVAEAVEEWGLHPLVVDPVAVASSGRELLSAGGRAALREVLLPLADLVTPNLAEAAILARWPEPPSDEDGMVRVAEAVLALGPAAVLVTGGHLPGSGAPDLLLRRDGGGPRWFRGRRLEARHTHGTGCVLSGAVTARLARGEDLVQAVEGAKAFVTAAIAAGVELGAGPGAVSPSGPCPP
jgi:hydroxymethylpyrimidine/phosphomethylpyrimidine kinase